MRYILFFFLFVTASFSVSAQSAEDSVKRVINRMFSAMKNADTAALRPLIADSALLQTIAVNKEGNTVVRNEPVNEFITVIGKLAAGDADERIRFELIKIDGPLASVWTPYFFYYKGAFSHCGVNSFQVVRINNQWKIQYIIDTRRKNNCQP